MKKIILFSGKAFNGKTEMSKRLESMLISNGYKVTTMRIAMYLKILLKEHYGWDGVTKDEYWRNKLQYLGTEIIREQLNMPTFHVNRIAEDIKIVNNDFDYVIIDDCRFLNEVDYMLNTFGKDICYSVRVIRTDFESPLSPEQLLHPSETGLDDYKDWNYIAKNRNNMFKDVHININKIYEDIIK